MDENGLSHVSRYSWNKREIVPEALTSSGRMDGVLLWSFGLFSWEHRVLEMYASVLVEGRKGRFRIPCPQGSVACPCPRYYAQTLALSMIEVIRTPCLLN